MVVVHSEVALKVGDKVEVVHLLLQGTPSEMKALPRLAVVQTVTSVGGKVWL